MATRKPARKSPAKRTGRSALQSIGRKTRRPKSIQELRTAVVKGRLKRGISVPKAKPLSKAKILGTPTGKRLADRKAMNKLGARRKKRSAQPKRKSIIPSAMRKRK